MGGISQFLGWAAGAIFSTFIINIIYQLLPQGRQEPPKVFHWLPFVGNAVRYGADPHSFYVSCRAKVRTVLMADQGFPKLQETQTDDAMRVLQYGDIFTFVLLGKRITCYFGVKGNEFILNGKHQDLNAEEIYGPLTTPVFGSDVVFDCPNSKLMEQKKFVKFGLTQQALECYVPLIEGEVLDYVNNSPFLTGKTGTLDVTKTMREITIFTASRSLQGAEVREKLTAEMASLYHDLDLGFKPVNFLLPWAPLPGNRKRDAAHAKMREVYMGIIEKRRRNNETQSSDMIWNLMSCNYKNGTPVPDKEIAHMMITLLMAGQHTSSSATSWIVLHLASRPNITEELYNEQIQYLAQDGQLQPLQYSDLAKLPLLRNVVKETLRMHPSIHSVMRQVKRPMDVPGTPYVVTPDKVLLASPLVTALSEEYFPNASEWEPHRWDTRQSKEDDDEVEFDELDFSKGTKSPYLPFGGGRHRCIGEKFAYLNLSVIIAVLVRQFRFRTMNGDKEVPATDYTSLFSTPMQPAFIRWERR